jgi:hypothetical protein
MTEKERNYFLKCDWTLKKYSKYSIEYYKKEYLKNIRNTKGVSKVEVFGFGLPH